MSDWKFSRRQAPRVTLLALAIIVLLPLRSSRAAKPAGETAPPATMSTEGQTGIFQVVWDLPGKADFPLIVAANYQRFGWKMEKETRDNLVEMLHESNQGQPVPDSAGKTPTDKPQPAKDKAGDQPIYTLYVPASYKPGQPYGLFVWFSSDDKPDSLPEGWSEVIEAHHMIWVTPHNAGHSANVGWRSFMALECVRHARQAFTLDEDRIYAGGFSDGGHVASEMAQVYPDIFKGTLCCGGISFYKDVSAGGNRYYPGFWAKPNGALLDLDRKVSRFVLQSASGDGHLGDMMRARDAMTKDGFKNVSLLESPGAKHVIPDSETFEKALSILDAPLIAGAQRQYQDAQSAEKSHRLGSALNDYMGAALRGGTQSFVADAQAKADALQQQYNIQFAAIQQFINDRQYDKALAAARDLQTKWAPYLTKERSAALMRQINDAKGAKH